jgi:hypothetical protein
MSILRKFAVVASVAALMTASVSTVSYAGDRRHGGGGYHGGGHNAHHGGHRGGRHNGGHRRGGGKGWIPFAVIGGLATLAIIAESSKRNDDRYYRGPSPAPYGPAYGPQPNSAPGAYGNSGYGNTAYGAQPGLAGGPQSYGGAPQNGSCQLAYKDVFQNGRNVRMGCTLCTNPNGTLSVVPGSEHVAQYLD